MKRLLVAALAATLTFGSVAVASSANARTPARATVHAQRVAHAVTVGKKKKKKKKKHKKPAVVKASFPLACVAEADGVAGDWTGAESQYEAAESAAAKNLSAALAFASLGSDAGLIALDQLDGSSTTTDVTNYNQDVSAYKSYFKGCSG